MVEASSAESDQRQRPTSTPETARAEESALLSGVAATWSGARPPG